MRCGKTFYWMQTNYMFEQILWDPISDYPKITCPPDIWYKYDPISSPLCLKCKNNCGTYRHLIRLSLKINKIKIVFVLVLWFSLYKKQILYCVKVKVSILLPTLTSKATRTFSHTQDSNPRLQQECLTHRTNHLLSWTFLALWSPDF